MYMSHICVYIYIYIHTHSAPSIYVCKYTLHRQLIHVTTNNPHSHSYIQTLLQRDDLCVCVRACVEICVIYIHMP